ncbi:MAG TPA: exodeoxyribonuclease VII large subunit [Oligoflexia bacterium]|nr:exodeoxyribonuclease VII large subunit [Oligoflexia bacterium]HMP48289.1 exodeoxyribonuclease VII large subunit [Oligoflexia bacterium]
MPIKKLDILLSLEKKSATFSGDTFLARETIKSLGSARWDSVRKSWNISNLSIGVDELGQLFPYANIEVIESSSGSNFKNQEPEINHESRHDLAIQINESGKNKNDLFESRQESGILAGASSVSDLSSLIKLAIARQFPGEVRVFGVISSLKIIGSGRIYFDLVDIDKSDHSLRCVIWEGGQEMLRPLLEAGFPLENDLPILLSAQVRLYQKTSQISLHVIKVIPEYTLGKLLAEREKTNRRLVDEGIFSSNKSLKLPFLPVKLGLLTSPGGTVINDFKSSLEVCGFGFKLVWCPVRVQGKEAVDDIVDGIKRLEKISDIDVILIFRGGGSAMELGIFNEYKIAKAICLCKKPVLSAIGHEFDQSSAQDVSMMSFGVPKDLGRFFSDMILEIKVKIKESVRNISLGTKHMISELESGTVYLASAIVNMFKLRLRDKNRALREGILQLSSYGALKVQNQNHELFVLRNSISANLAAQVKSYANKLVSTMQNVLSGVNKERNISNNRISLVVQGISTQGWSRYYSCISGIKRYVGIAELSSFIVSGKEILLKEKETLFEAVSPEAQLKRGFALIKKSHTSGCYLTSIDQIAREDSFLIQMKDGEGLARIVEAGKKVTIS